MALNKTKYLRKKVLDHFFGRVEYSFPANVYAALFTADPTDEGLLTNELDEDGYARIEISALMADAVESTGSITNANDIEFGPAAEDWPEITHIGIMDASTAGNMLYFGAAATSRVVDNGDDFPIRPGQLVIRER